MAEEAVELGYYAAVLRRHRWLVGGLAALGALGAATTLGSTTFTATAEVVVRPIATSPGDTIDAERAINTSTEQQIATSTAVAEIANEAMRVDDARDLLDNVTVVVPVDSQILRFQYEADSSDEARDGAQAFAEAYLTYRSRDAAADVAERISGLQAEIDALTTQLVEANTTLITADNAPAGGGPDVAAVAEAQSRRELLLSALSVANATLGGLQELRIDPGEVIAPATDATPNTQSKVILLAAGFGIGAVLGAVAAFVVDRVRARINVASDLQEEMGVPVLATIPAVARRSQVMVTHTEPRTRAAHAYRRLAVALSLGQEQPARSVLVVGATATDPATTVALNLAIALIQQGRRVLLVSGDRHDPQIDRCFDLVGQPGLDEYLARRGTTEPQEVLRGLLVLPAGSGQAYPIHNVPPREAITSIIDRGHRIADIVLIDAPPALDYPDAEVMGPLVDAVITVAAAERTTRHSVADLRDRLTLVGAPVRGSVLVRRPTLRDRFGIVVSDRRAAAAAGAVPSARSRGEAPAAPTEAPAAGHEPAGAMTDSAALKERINALLKERGVEPHPTGPNGQPAANGSPVPGERPVGS